MRTELSSTAFLSNCSPENFHFRIYTFGSFHIDWVDPTTGQIFPLPPERFQGQNAGSALGLLKALLGCPDRFATRAWLMEQFWPNSRQQSANERLSDVASSLRGLLRPPGYTGMLVHFVHGADGRGTGFRLDAYPRIWCDADAFEWYVKHAMLLERRGQDATVCWERAYLLAERGQYLPEQMYDEWARLKRDALTGFVRDCIQRWTHLLHQAGHVDEAIMRLRAYWLDHRTDEDALRPLLEMLGERERFQEVEEYYAKAQAAVQEDGYELHERTLETLEVVRALKVQRPLSLQQHLSLPPASQTVSRDIIEIARIIEGTTPPLLNQGETTMFDPTKRQTLEALLAAVSVALVKPQGLDLWKPLLAPTADVVKANPEIMQGLRSLIEACWQFSRGTELALAEKLLPECMTRLVPLAQQPSPYQQEAINLTAQGFRLSGILALHRNDLFVKELYCKQAVRYSLLSGDRAILVASLRDIADTYRYNNQYPQMLQTYLNALQYKENISPLFQSCMHSGLAIAYAHVDQKQKALTHLGLALDTFPEHPSADSGYSFADFDRAWLILREGIIRTRLGQTEQALGAFKRVDQPGMIIPERIRVEIVNQQGKAAIIAEDLEQATAYTMAGITGAKALGSQRRYSEAYANFQQMSLLWPQEQRVTELGELFH